jgi:hypothetical protein
MIRSQKVFCKFVKLLRSRQLRSYSTTAESYDVAVIGGGISGASVAARLQALGHSTCILESHSVLGGCAGYYEKAGFSFDVGATTFVDFETGGVGGEFLESIGMKCPLEESEVIPGFPILSNFPTKKVTNFTFLPTKVGHTRQSDCFVMVHRFPKSACQYLENLKM